MYSTSVGFGVRRVLAQRTKLAHADRYVAEPTLLEFSSQRRLALVGTSCLPVSASFACLCAVVAVAVPFAGATGQMAQPEPVICPIPRSAEPLEFLRPHQIPTRPAHDDPTHKVVTPGGMILDTPKMVAAVDVLRVEARDASVMCFALTTAARDRHRCEIAGVAQLSSNSTYVFREQELELRFRFQSDGAVKVEPVGEGYKRRCEPQGHIAAAVYTRP